MATALKRLIERMKFYEWAYGALEEADFDLGVLGEYMVGRHLGCLTGNRRNVAPVDLTLGNGRTVEVKTTSAETGGRGKARWRISEQRAALSKGKSKADSWIFLTADFRPRGRSVRVDPLDERNWSCYVATAAQVLSTGSLVQIGESTLKKLGLSSIPLSQLDRSMI